MDLRNGNAVIILAQNDDTDGNGGLFDQPAEVLLKGKRLHISNFDKPEKHSVNSKSDVPHAMSIIDLLQAARELTSLLAPFPKKEEEPEIFLPKYFSRKEPSAIRWALLLFGL